MTSRMDLGRWLRNLGECIRPAEPKRIHRPNELEIKVIKIIDERYIGGRAELAEQTYSDAAQIIAAVEN